VCSSDLAPLGRLVLRLGTVGPIRLDISKTARPGPVPTLCEGCPLPLLELAGERWRVAVKPVPVAGDIAREGVLPGRNTRGARFRRDHNQEPPGPEKVRSTHRPFRPVTVDIRWCLKRPAYLRDFGLRSRRAGTGWDGERGGKRIDRFAIWRAKKPRDLPSTDPLNARLKRFRRRVGRERRSLPFSPFPPRFSRRPAD
jgi:hypothetical protein